MYAITKEQTDRQTHRQTESFVYGASKRDGNLRQSNKSFDSETQPSV